MSHHLARLVDAQGVVLGNVSYERGGVKIREIVEWFSSDCCSSGSQLQLRPMFCLVRLWR